MVVSTRDSGRWPTSSPVTFTERGEIGAAFAVYQDGRKVVDLWGGYRNGNRRTPWAEDTIVTVYSSTKGVAGLLIARARDRGQIDYDRPVADYWPEFAANGKSAITIRQLLAHQAGLSALARPITLAELRDPILLDALLADAVPLWTPGSRHGYHAATIGFYEDALLRRVDPRHRSLGTVLTEDVRPQGAEFYIGVRGDVDRERIATVHGFDNAELAGHIDEMPAAFVAALNDPTTLTGRTFTTNQAAAGVEAVNQPEVLALELPSGNGTGQVRSIAALYSDALNGGPLLGLPPARSTSSPPPPWIPPRDAATSCCTSTPGTRSDSGSPSPLSASVATMAVPSAVPARAAHSRSPTPRPESASPTRRTVPASASGTTRASWLCATRCSIPSSVKLASGPRPDAGRVSAAEMARHAVT
ncbi:serine hydrolase domain-containing protein [Streptomyces sp. EKR5.2]|uniref:serine hydrolase domain-containing protein n=1 Tax=Streptomyces sp. EKR5.2 TaxID=3461014 RepID=UPI0040424297